MSDFVELRSVQCPRLIGDRRSVTLGSGAHRNACLREVRSAQSALGQSLLATSQTRPGDASSRPDPDGLDTTKQSLKAIEAAVQFAAADIA